MWWLIVAAVVLVLFVVFGLLGWRELRRQQITPTDAPAAMRSAARVAQPDPYAELRDPAVRARVLALPARQREAALARALARQQRSGRRRAASTSTSDAAPAAGGNRQQRRAAARRR